MREPPDPAWRPDADLRALVGDLGGQLAELRCGESLCRLALVSGSPADDDRLVRRLVERAALHPAIASGAVVHRDGDGPRARLILYVTRAGRDLGDAASS